MPRGDSQALIAARQKREMYMEDFAASQAAEGHQRMVVAWETRADARMDKKDLYRHLDNIQAQHNETLVERRRRLADLLLREKEEHERRLAGLAETDEQRRERIIRKAKELRATREAAKRADTAARNDRLFREKVDCLRQAESRLKVMQVADGRYDQIEGARRRAEEEADEAAYFAQQAAESSRLAHERAQRDLEARYRGAQRLNEDLAAQVEGNNMRRAMAAEEQRKETEEFNRQVHAAKVQEAQERLARREAQQRLAEEMKELNAELERARREEYDRLKAEDRALLDSILAEIAEEQRKEAERKTAQREAQRAQWLELQQQRSQQKEDGKALDQMWAEANDREWEKREAQWKADRDRREALMRSILIARRQQVLDKRQQERDDAAAKKAEHEAFLEALARDDGSDAEARRKRMAQEAETRQFLDWQIAQRRAARDQERDDKLNELSAHAAMEKEFEDRIRQEMRNLEAARPERFRDVPLLPPRQRNNMF